MPKKIVIIGGGFAGVNFAKSLANYEGFNITLVDKNNYNFFPPLLYQVATGFLEPSSISYPFRTLFREIKNINFWLGEFLKVEPETNNVMLSNGELTYDYIVFATGTQTNWFGLKNVQEHAIPMKTLDDALGMRNTILQRIEKATKTQDAEEKKRLITIVVAGGGPTGVEVSGMFAEMNKSVVRKEYPELSNIEAEIYLVSGGDVLLGPMSTQSQHYTLDALKDLGVKVMLNSRVVDYDGEYVALKNGTKIASRNLIWATGVTAFRFEGLADDHYGHSNRLKVDAYNKIISTENIYAIGDASIMDTDEDFPKGHPQLAQVAIQQGKNLAKNLKKIKEGKNPEAFTYNDKGSMAIIGKSKAVADLPKPNFHLKGFIAWFIWSFVHLLGLINYHDRLRIFINWSISYFSNNQDLRMIIRPNRGRDQ